MNRLYKFFFLLGISGAFFSCEKEVILDFGDEQQDLAIFSLFSPNDFFTDNHNINIEVTATQSILEYSASNYINDARVSVTSRPMDGEDKQDKEVDPGGATVSEAITEEAISYAINNSDRIIYRTDNTVPADGYTYTLTVEHPDYPTVTAESHVPNITEIENLEVNDFKKSKDGQLEGTTRYFSETSFELDNTIDIEKQFHLRVWLVTDSPDGRRPHAQININDENLAEEIGTDATIVNAVNSPVFFGAHFTNKNFEGDSQKLNFDIEFAIADDHYPSAIRYELRSVSKEYHNYFVEGYRLSQAGSNPLFVQSNNISNNIEGGFGIFAGFSVFDQEVPFRK